MFSKTFKIAILFCFPFFSVAQEENPQINSESKLSPFSIRVDFSVPNPINEAWKRCMVGVAEGNITFNYKIPKTNFFAGLGYKGNQFYTPPKFFVFDLKTKMRMHGAYFVLGYDILQNNSLFFTPSLNAGWSSTTFLDIVCEKKTLDYTLGYNSWLVEPGLHINFVPEANFGISCNFTFVLTSNKWDPEYICMNEHFNLEGIEKNSSTTYYNLGLGLYWGIGKR